MTYFSSLIERHGRTLTQALWHLVQVDLVKLLLALIDGCLLAAFGLQLAIHHLSEHVARHALAHLPYLVLRSVAVLADVLVHAQNILLVLARPCVETG